MLKDKLICLQWSFQRTVFTFAFRTVQRKELVALSYRRSNSNVPKEAGKQLIKKKKKKLKCATFVIS